MMATIVQAWTKSLLKTRLHNIFKGDRSLSSIMFHNKISKEELLEEKGNITYIYIYIALICNKFYYIIHR